MEDTCKIALAGAFSHNSTMEEMLLGLREMNRKDEKSTLINGFEYTQGEAIAKAQSNANWVKENLRRYKECLKTGSLPHPKIVD
jgi:hypothetical protein